MKYADPSCENLLKASRGQLLLKSLLLILINVLILLILLLSIDAGTGTTKLMDKEYARFLLLAEAQGTQESFDRLNSFFSEIAESTQYLKSNGLMFNNTHYDEHVLYVCEFQAALFCNWIFWIC